jgi:hypothetical protein
MASRVSSERVLGNMPSVSQMTKTNGIVLSPGRGEITSPCRRPFDRSLGVDIADERELGEKFVDVLELAGESGELGRLFRSS